MTVETPTPSAAPTAPKPAEAAKVAPAPMKDPKTLIAEADAVIKDSQIKIEEARKQMASKPESQLAVASNMELVKRKLSTLRQQVEASQHALREKQKVTQIEDEYRKTSEDISNLDNKRKEIAKTEYLAGNAHLKWQTAVNALDKVGETVGTVVSGAANGVNTVYKTLIEPVVRALGTIGKPAWNLIKKVVGKANPQVAGIIDAIAPADKPAEQVKPDAELQSVLSLLTSNRVAVTPPAGVASQDLLLAIDSSMEIYKSNAARGIVVPAGTVAPTSSISRGSYAVLVAKAIDKKNQMPGTVTPMTWEQFIAAANDFNEKLGLPAAPATQNAAPATAPGTVPQTPSTPNQVPATPATPATTSTPKS